MQNKQKLYESTYFIGGLPRELVKPFHGHHDHDVHEKVQSSSYKTFMSVITCVGVSTIKIMQIL